MVSRPQFEPQGTPSKEPFSILLVCATYPPVLGGSEIEAQRVCSALLRRGHSVTVLCAGGPPMPDLRRWVDPAGVPVRILAQRRHGRLRDLAFALGVAWTLVRERRRYRLVYFLMQGMHLAVGLPVARLLGKAIVMKISGSSIITLMRQSWMGRLELRWLDRWAHRVMILNKGMAEEALEAGISPQRLLWMPNPVDTAGFAPCGPDLRGPLRAQLGIPANSAVVVFVGRLAPEKELATLLDAFGEAADSIPSALLLLVGDGPCREELERQAASQGISARVRFAGRQTPAEVRLWLQASDVFALVSSNEGFPCSLLEAMAVELPSVVSDIPANTQLVAPEVHGLHVAAGDCAAIAKALARLLGDRALRARMGAAARQHVLENYSTDKVLERYETLFQEATAGR